ncbi:MAG: S49 family peptidase [Rickettsiales bacterium]|nr:S49 family peptidase [Rickettsiales bacterium]
MNNKTTTNQTFCKSNSFKIHADQNNCNPQPSNNCKIYCFFKKICCFYKSNKPVIAHVALNGVIGKDSKFSSGLNIENILPLLEKAFKTSNIKAVAITINSPGGSPVQSELIYNAIRELSQEKKIPVYTFARDVAASGGYWLLLAGDEIYAHQASIIGSIGVIFSGFGFVDTIKKLGIERRIYTEGKNKAILDPFMPEEQENIAILKEAQRDIFEGFKELVSSRRAGKLKDGAGKIICNCTQEKYECANCECGDKNFLDDKIFTGAFWSGRKAVELGLVDAIADMRSKMKEKFGEKVGIKNIDIKKGFIKSFFAEKSGLALGQVVVEIVDKLEEKASFGRFGL